MSESSIELNAGINIAMSSIRQHFTYSGMLEGFPHFEVNRSYVDRHLELFPPDCDADVPAHLIDPVLIPASEYEMTLTVPYTIEYLPPVTCIACFHSGSDDPDEIYRLRIIWYQSDFGDIEAGIVEQIKQIEWYHHAKRYSIMDF